MSKLFRYRQINSLFSSSLPFFKSRQFCPSIKFYLSTKQQEKTQKKIEKEKLSENVAKLETMADQEELTQETIKKLIALRREEINSVAAETDIPKNALITAAVITLPVLIGGPLINIFCMQNLFMQYTPAILAAYLKYSAVHLNFMAGIHWGFAISEHNCQVDAVNSTKTVRTLFIAASLPMFVSFGLVSSLAYSVGMAASMKCLHVGGLVLTHLYVLALDNYVVKNNIAPKWFLKIKIWCALISIIGIANLFVLFMNFDEQVKEKNDVYKRFLQKNQERLHIKLKE